MEKVTKEQVEFWLSPIESDWNKSEILEDLRDLANGVYKPEVLKNDIIAVSYTHLTLPTILRV